MTPLAGQVKITALERGGDFVRLTLTSVDPELHLAVDYRVVVADADYQVGQVVHLSVEGERATVTRPAPTASETAPVSQVGYMGRDYLDSGYPTAPAPVEHGDAPPAFDAATLHQYLEDLAAALHADGVVEEACAIDDLLNALYGPETPS